MSQTGVLLVGHGTRSAAGIGCVQRLGRLVAERMPQQTVRHCFLELHDQSIGWAIDELAAVGVQRLAVVPVLLFAAGHARSDIPEQCRASAVGRMELQQADVLGCHPALVELSHRRFLETLSPAESVVPGKTCLLLVGRGSYDAEATAEMRRFAERRQDRLPGVDVQVAFIAMAKPAVAEAIENLAASDFEQIVVQPHLLFPGELFDGLRQRVLQQAQIPSKQQWRLAPLLAGDLGSGDIADRLLVDAIVDRAADALSRFGVAVPPHSA